MADDPTLWHEFRCQDVHAKSYVQSLMKHRCTFRQSYIAQKTKGTLHAVYSIILLRRMD